MSTMASQITSPTIVYSTVYSGSGQRKHQSSASLAFVRGIHRWPANSPHKRPVTWKMFPFWWRHHDLTQWWSTESVMWNNGNPGQPMVAKEFKDKSIQSRPCQSSRLQIAPRIKIPGNDVTKYINLYCHKQKSGFHYPIVRIRACGRWSRDTCLAVFMVLGEWRTKILFTIMIW